MVSQAITFFIAGFETSSNLLAFTLYELSLHPECLEKLRKEIFKMFPDETSPLAFDKLQQFTYLDMVIAGKTPVKNVFSRDLNFISFRIRKNCG